MTLTSVPMKIKLFYLAPLLILLVVFSRLARFDFDPSIFILAEKQWVTQESLIHDIRLFDLGYDGLFFYRYALSPFERDTFQDGRYGAYGVTIDNPVYRRSRVVYPVIAWLLALGKTYLIPWTLILANVIGFMAMVFLFGKISIYQGWPASMALIPLGLAANWLGLARNLSDIFGLLFISWAYFEYIRSRHWNFLGLSFLALLSRESAIFVLLPAFFSIGYRFYKQRQWITLTSLLLPFFLYAVWIVFLRNVYGSESHRLDQEIWKHFSLPVEGITKGFSRNITWVYIFTLCCHGAIFFSSLKIFLKHFKQFDFSWTALAIPLHLL